jgi:hypothetical protein
MALTDTDGGLVSQDVQPSSSDNLPPNYSNIHIHVESCDKWPGTCKYTCIFVCLAEIGEDSKDEMYRRLISSKRLRA